MNELKSSGQADAIEAQEEFCRPQEDLPSETGISQLLLWLQMQLNRTDNLLLFWLMSQVRVLDPALCET